MFTSTFFFVIIYATNARLVSQLKYYSYLFSQKIRLAVDNKFFIEKSIENNSIKCEMKSDSVSVSIQFIYFFNNANNMRA